MIMKKSRQEFKALHLQPRAERITAWTFHVFLQLAFLSFAQFSESRDSLRNGITHSGLDFSLSIDSQDMPTKNLSTGQPDPDNPHLISFQVILGHFVNSLN